MKKLLLFTFDYELFLGQRSGGVDDCIIKPTYKLLQLLNQYQFKGIFFVDTVYLLRLKEIAKSYPKAAKDDASIMEQLGKLVKDGHYIFPHIHPHWLDAIYLSDINEWNLENLRYYKFASVPPDKQQELFDGSIELLQSITRPIDRNIPLDAYRAGGWSIQPFNYFKPHFEKHGIRHEFSVIPGRYQRSTAHYYDFRTAPINRPVYKFREDVCVTDERGPYTEWTISVMSITNLGQWFDFSISGLLQRLRITGKQKGSTVSSAQKIEGDVYDDEKSTRYVATFEELNPYRVLRYLKTIKNNDYFHFISHPKLLSDFELRMVGLLFRSLRKKNTFETDFRKAFSENGKQPSNLHS